MEVALGPIWGGPGFMVKHDEREFIDYKTMITDEDALRGLLFY